MTLAACSLCSEKSGLIFWESPRYWRCQNCQLIWLDPALHPDPSAEKKRYEAHTNSSESSEYRNYLLHSLKTIKAQIPIGKNIRGLDYGCGPSALTPELTQPWGWQITAYDPYFYPSALEIEMENNYFDFILCQESAEHFFQPYKDFSSLLPRLKSGGWLIIHTASPPQKPADFFSWYYRRDPTHVVFYSPATMHWLAEKFNLSLPIHAEPALWLWQKI